LDQFEVIAITNKWTDEQIILIYPGLFVDETKKELLKTSYISLRNFL